MQKGMSSRYIIFVNRVEFINELNLSDKANTYCTLSIGNKRVSTFVAKECGKYPHWEQYFEIHLSGKEKILMVEVFESKRREKGALLANGSFNLASMQKERSKGLWIELYSKGSLVGNFIMGVQINPRELPKALSPFKEESSSKTPMRSFFSRKATKNPPIPLAFLDDCTQCTREHIIKTKILTRSKELDRKDKIYSAIKKICSLSACLSPMYLFKAKPIKEIHVNLDTSDDEEEEIAALMDKDFATGEVRIVID